jgi:ankyrin repeat protein
MKYLRLFENFEGYDPYELMVIPPNKKAEMIAEECKKQNPNLNLVHDLITLGANVDWQNEDDQNRTLLHYAIRYRELEIARMLIGAGADVNLQDDDRGMAPLHWAASDGLEEFAQMLIGAGADVNMQDKIGQTSLHWAAEFTDVEFVRMLVEAGAIKDIRNIYDQTPYDLARNWQMEELLAIE